MNCLNKKRVMALTLSLLSMATGVLTTACNNTGENTQETTNTTPTTTPTSETTSASGNGLKLGTLAPTTGDLASLGQNFPVATNLAVETINACGGVNDAPVTMIVEDDETDPAKGVTAMTKLAEADKVAGVIGSFASSVSMAAIDIAVRNKVMMISPGSTSQRFTTRAEKGDFKGYWARTAPPDTYQAQALAALAYQKGFKKVSLVVINNDYGVGFEEPFITAFEKLGGTVLTKDKPVRYDEKATTLDSEAKAAFDGKPDAVVAILYPDTGAILLKSAYEQGLSAGIPVLLTDGVQTDQFPKDVGQTADGKFILAGSLGTVPGADGKALEAFKKLWAEKVKKDMTAFTSHSYDAAVLLMLAAQAAKTNTGEGIQSKITEVANAPGTEVTDPCEALKLVKEGQDINYQGASGNVDIDKNGDVIGSYDIWEVQADGKIKVIDKVNPVVEK
jgi:neutral amino acid transport system substrate-binding protein